MSFNAHLVEMNQRLNDLEDALLNEYGYPASHDEAGTNALKIYIAKVKESAQAISDEYEEAEEIVEECEDFRDSLSDQDGDPIGFDTKLGIELGLKGHLINLRNLVNSIDE
ncbi:MULTISPECIES: hypothetical protein [unclassified Marinobacter]|uniref:hypothetical protein n=1 Tax=unclassified Marinobacter TaxID=83889 RepID=UPI00192621D6|nr:MULTISPECIES: hypothetical protein [unclassified Marinobacter]MBL3824253.1 hypothetical protein [Marinobacter sp. MC3]MBL3892655.1 hypothetical protein [Marinobacter sp. MW3]